MIENLSCWVPGNIASQMLGASAGVASDASSWWIGQLQAGSEGEYFP